MSGERLAEELGVPWATLREWCRKGRGPRSLPLTDGGSRSTIRFPRPWVNEWLRERAEAAAARRNGNGREPDTEEPATAGQAVA